MQCQVCGREIGLSRRLWDRQYCCDRHRKAARRLSARALRETEEYDDLEEPWLITPGLSDERPRSSGAGFNPAVGILLLVCLIFVVLVIPPSQNSAAAPRATSRRFSFPDNVKRLIPGAPTVDYRTDFHAGLTDWVGQFGEAADGWSRKAGKIHLGRLRLWKPTLSMANYQMVFQGEIESRAMGWAFRATNLDNYYATKIAVPGPGGPQRPEIIRYVVVGGEKRGMIQLPLPLSLEANTPYKVHVRVRDNEFSTLINGQVVDTWSNTEHKKGGIGFFSEPGEHALISWVRVNDADGFLSRLFSFSLLVGPPDLMAGPPGSF